MRRSTKLAIGPVVALAAGGAAAAAGLSNGEIATAAVTGLCAAWWVLEPISIPATSLIPFVAFPAAGVLDHEEVAVQYGHHMILLLLGGFMLSAAVEKSGAHRRMALGMVRIAGRGGRGLIAGFMLASALSSMWISNTATTLVLLPVALAVTEQHEGGDRLALPLLLGIAYAASIGGMATPIGTPPNLIFMSNYEQATGETISFLAWMKIGVPAVAALLPIAWLYLTRGLRGVVAPEVPGQGPWRSAEVRVMLVFAATALLWVFRTAPLGGWSGAVGMTGVGDSTVALAAVVVLFVASDAGGEPLLDWQTARRIPWGLLLLFGGGLAISAAFKASGLSVSLGQLFERLDGWPPILVTLAICLAVTFMTEVTSNTATTSLLMPVLIAAATTLEASPEQLMIPATLSASCAFMLPVATAPNAIMAGTGQVSTRDMARTGIWLNLLGALALTAVVSLLLR